MAEDKRRAAMQDNQNVAVKKPSYLRTITRVYIFAFAMLVVLFVSAGRLNYWQGWLVGGIFIAVIIGFSLVFADKKDVIFERARPGPGTKWWDKIFYALYIPASMCVFIVSALDGGRFHWSPSLPVSVYVISFLVFIFSYIVILWCMWTNKFFSSTVRIQTDRGHQVIQDGPYRFVRHPGYLAAIFWFVSVTLTLGSVYGLIPVAVVIVLFIVRTYLEDITLQKELPGYSDYAKKVLFRLIPHIW
jgi:protein-S-isoprenylcysteine O-methyltransferase Ste14